MDSETSSSSAIDAVSGMTQDENVVVTFVVVLVTNLMMASMSICVTVVVQGGPGHVEDRGQRRLPREEQLVVA